MKLTDFIVEDAIITELKATEKEAVIKEMVCALKDVRKINSKDVENVIKSLMKREELGSTGIGKGVAVPHTKHDSAKKLLERLHDQRKVLILMPWMASPYISSFFCFPRTILQVHILPHLKEYLPLSGIMISVALCVKLMVKRE